MWKDNKKTIILTSIMTLMPIVVGLIFWNQLPEQVATHFGYDGEPNGWSSKWFTVFGIPVVMTALHLLCIFGTRKDPGYERYPEKMRKFILWICPCCCWICMIATYGYAINGKMDISGWMLACMSFMFIFIGNYLPKVKQNRYLGIKLPWTYADETNWNKTHRFGGKVWVLGGILMFLNIFIKIKYFEIFLLSAMILVPTIYSYLYSRKKEK